MSHGSQTGENCEEGQGRRGVLLSDSTYVSVDLVSFLFRSACLIFLLF